MYSTTAAASGLSLIGVLALVGVFGGSSIAGMHQLVRLAEEDVRLNFFGLPLPWLVFVLIYFIAVIAITFLAVRRKMESERQSSLSKPQALGAATMLGLLILGGAGNINDLTVRAVVVLYALAIVGVVLASVVTPSRNRYIQGLWRSHKLEIAEPSAWSDDALNRPFLACLCAVLMAVATITLGGGRGQFEPATSSLAIALPVLVVAYSGLAIQFFKLRLGRGAKSFIGLFLFVAWIAPLLVGLLTIASRSRPRADEVAQGVFALSPLAGVGMLASNELDEGRRYAEAAAVTSSLFYLFVFNALIGSTKRRVRRRMLKAAQPEPSIGEGEAPAEPGAAAQYGSAGASPSPFRTLLRTKP